MSGAFSEMELAMLVGGLGIASIVAGLVAGLLGVGGGIVIVPVLYWLFTLIDFPESLSMHMAVATSLFTIMFTSISSMRAHEKKGAVDRDLLKRWVPGAALGALTGGILAGYFSADIL